MNLKNLLLVIAIVVVVIGAAVFLMSNQAHPKDDSKLVITSNATLTEGDNFTVRLTDMNNTPIPNQSLNITVVSGSSGSIQKTLVTDSNGEVSFEVDTSAKGNCAVKVKYAGNEKFNGCNLTDNVRIEPKVVIIQNATNVTFNNNTTTYHSNQIETVEDSYSYYDNYYDGNVVTYEDY